MTVAELTALDQTMHALTNDQGACRSCLVIAVTPGDVYCAACTADVLEYLAARN
jgi:hypothetical protein